MKKLLAAAAASTVMMGAAHAAQILIDDFDQTIATSLGFSATPSSNFATDTYSIGSLTWDRRVDISANMSVAEAIGIFEPMDQLVFATSGVSTVVASVTWDLVSGSLDLTNSATFESVLVDQAVSSNDLLAAGTLTLQDGSSVSDSVAFTLNQGDTELSVALADFSGVDLSDVTKIVLELTSNTEGVDLELEDAIFTTAIPVPGALPLMLAGVGFLVARRSRNI